MGLKNFITGTIGLATVGGVIGAYNASTRLDGVEAVPDVEIDRLFTAYAPTRTAVALALELGDLTNTSITVPPTVVRAYRAPGLMPSHHAAIAAFGGREVKGSSYIRSDGAKITIESTSLKAPIPGVASLYALQALEGCGPHRRRAMARIFYNTFRISDLYHYVMHYTSDAKKVHEDIVSAAAAHDKKAIHSLIAHYGERSMEVEGGAVDIELRGDVNAAAIVFKSRASPKEHEEKAKSDAAAKVDAGAMPVKMLGTCLHRLGAVDFSGEKETPRTVLVDVIYTAPNPYAQALTSSPYEVQIREWCADTYGRLLAASVAASLAKL